jgi:hypothetical protein
MAATNDDLDKVELPKIWQIIQLWSVQSMVGSIGSSYFITLDWVSKAVIKGLGATGYGILLGTFLVLGAISIWGAGTKGFQYGIKMIKLIKFGKDE